MIVDMENICDSMKESPVIIKHKTGVFYTVQAGGNFCLHPKVEGYHLINVCGEYFPDSCEHFCNDKVSYADRKPFERAFNSVYGNYSEYFKMVFDSGSDELLEGFIPVKVYYYDSFNEVILNWVPGITTDWNCD